MAEVFKIWGTFSLKEEGGPIDKRIDNITDAAQDARRPLNQLSSGLEDVAHDAAGTSRQFDNLSDSLDDIEDSARDAARPLEQVGSAADDSEGAINDLIGGFDELGGVAGGAAAIIGGIFVAALVESVSYSKGLQKQLKDVARRTNATAKEVDEYKNNLENLFKEGFTNDINDIGEAFTVSAKQTDLSGQKLEDFTKKIMFLSKRLETDYGETIKTVDGLARDFGITHDEVFNLLAKGYDENLNVTGELLDLFSEYGPILQNIGIDEQEMLSILVSAREKGIFSYDQLLAGAQEFNDRVYEMLSDEEEAKEFFDQLNLKATDVKKAFEEGGQAADSMRGQIIYNLSEIQNPIEQAKIGTELYGEGWLVTGGKINDVMLNSQSRGVETKKAMDDLIETDTDPLAKEWNNFYNTWKADTLEPIGKELTDLSLDFLTFFNQTNKDLEDWLEEWFNQSNTWMDKVYDEFEGFMDSTFDLFDELPGILWEAGQLAGDGFIELVEWFVDDAISTMNDLKEWVQPVTDAFDSLSSGISKAINKIGNIKFPSKPSWIPGFATGVEDFEGGLAKVGERGEELVYLPPGSNVYSNQDTNKMLNNLKDNKSTINNLSTISTSGGNTYNINMQVSAESIKGLSDLVDLFENINAEYIAQ